MATSKPTRREPLFVWRTADGQVLLNQGQGWVSLEQGLKRSRPGTPCAVGWWLGTLLRPPTRLTAEAGATLAEGIAGLGALGAKMVVIGSNAKRSLAGRYLFAYANRHGMPLYDLKNVVAVTAAPTSGQQLITLWQAVAQDALPQAGLFILPRRRVHEVLTSLRRRAHEANAGPVTAAVWAAVLARYQRTCVGCGVGGKLTAAHIVPVSRGGLSTEDNLQPLCQSCNSRKGDLALDLRQASLSFGAWQTHVQTTGEYPLLELYQAVATYIDAYVGLTALGRGWAHAAWTRADKRAARYSRAATIDLLHAVGLGRTAHWLDQLWQMFAGRAGQHLRAACASSGGQCFRPNDQVRRGELSKIVHRAMKSNP